MINNVDPFHQSVSRDFDGVFVWDPLAGCFPRGIMPMVGRRHRGLRLHGTRERCTLGSHGYHHDSGRITDYRMRLGGGASNIGRDGRYSEASRRVSRRDGMQEFKLMDDLDEMTKFLGRAGNLYGRKNLCAPFRLKEFAEVWRLEGIPLSHCIEQIIRHLAESSGQYRCGSGDGGLARLDAEIRQSWHRLTRPSRALPERTDRLYKRSTDDAIADPGDQWIIDLVKQTPRTAQPIGLKPIEKAGLRGEAPDVPSHPTQMGPSPRSASDRTGRAPDDPIGLKPIDQAEAFLRRELANGEVAAAVIEEYARDDGISLRTLLISP
jgi:hypothetical protein